MIEINLLPEELRGAQKAAPREAPVDAAAGIKKILPLAAVFFVLLILLQVILAVAGAMEGAQLRLLTNKWDTQEPQRKILEKFNKEYAILNEDAAAAAQLVKERVAWAPKLYTLSAALPPGVWINELSVNSGNFTLQGSVLSPQGREMGLINDFLVSLKGDSAFYADFANLELGSVQRRQAGPYKIEDFILAGTLKR